MKNFQGRLPIILSVFFISAICYASWIKLRSLTGTDLLYWAIALIFLYLTWIILESKIATKEIDHKKTSIDRLSLEIYALSRGVVVLAALVLPLADQNLGMLQLVGFFLFISAVTFRLIAIRSLGKFYSHRVRVQDEHQIINKGPYGFVRHPAYTGMILSHLGFVLFFYNPWSLALWAFFHVPAVVYRILVEEKALFTIPGYSEYASTRKRLLPAVW